MTWLSENWLWLAVAIGGFLLMTRMHGMGMGCGMAGGHHGGSQSSHPDQESGGITIDHDTRANLGPSGTIDPVSRRPVSPEAPHVLSAYNGLVYWFESRDNRDAFEREPEKYLADGAVSGQPEEQQHGSAHRRHGCC